ncbi:MAG: transcription termination factor NusA [Candidatus Dojkabacteria bacterium]|nr:transcription termination factor NusA [Candidatus Dojkabacteria bacterium]
MSKDIGKIDFLAAIYQIAEERGLDVGSVLEQVKNAYLTAYKRWLKENEGVELTAEELKTYTVEIDQESGEISILANREVVDLVSNPNTQISEAQAKLIDTKLRTGDTIMIDVTPDNFGRIAAKAAFQRLLQGLRDAELNVSLSKFVDRVGKIVVGVIQRKDSRYVRVEVDKVEAIMPIYEAIPGENYRSSERKKFLLVKLQNSENDKRMVLSRASEDFIKAIFEMEVPEVANGSVEIVSIAREPGSRTKIAVRSKNEKIDAIGACVGPKGTRIDSIMNEVNPEKIDIIQYSDDPATYIANALSPARIMNIRMAKKSKAAVVLVSDDMFSLAIGKDGQNVRLAVKLTGYKIDITNNKEEFENFKFKKIIKKSKKNRENSSDE